MPIRGKLSSLSGYTNKEESQVHYATSGTEIASLELEPTQTAQERDLEHGVGLYVVA